MPRFRAAVMRFQRVCTNAIRLIWRSRSSEEPRQVDGEVAQPRQRDCRKVRDDVFLQVAVAGGLLVVGQFTPYESDEPYRRDAVRA
jgi:hypothetical protein